MTEFAVMPLADYAAACDAVRALDGGTDAIVSGALATRIAALSAAESGSAAAGKIYGVRWDRSGSTKLTRTDDAADFSEPVPAIGGTGGSCPFDYILPWAGIQKIEDAAAWTMVVIPKFYYRWVDSSDALTLQIASEPVSGFSVSPAHMARGDGAGERDVVYLARYKCAGTAGISISGEVPTATLTRAAFREGAAALGTGYSQQDFAMFWTLRMLFLVEYASWDGQSSIGCGCGDGSAAAETGTTDGMTYHTGTMQESLDAYGQGVQYRWIEDPWGGLLEWVDGCYFDGDHNLFLIPNPADFSDDTGGTEVGALNLYGYVTEWYIPTADGFEWALLPAAVGGSAGSYIPDSCGLFSGPCMTVGGQYKQQSTVAGPFRIYATSVSAAYATIGARLQRLP